MKGRKTMIDIADDIRMIFSLMPLEALEEARNIFIIKGNGSITAKQILKALNNEIESR